VSRYVYFCLNAGGAELRGALEAPDEISARRKLREQGMKVLSLAEGDVSALSGQQGWREALWRAKRALAAQRSIKNSERMLFFQQMSLMLGAGYTLLESLSACGKLSAGARLHRIAERSAERIRRGSSFSAAVSGEKELFSRLAVQMVEAGELSGELGAVFDRLAILTERSVALRRQIVIAMIYPGFVFLVGVGVVTYLVTGVMPKLVNFLSGRGKALPWAARTMMDVSDWLSSYGGLILLGIAGAVIGIPLMRKVDSLRWGIDRGALSLPVFGGAFAAAAMAQAAWIFGMLIQSRLTVLEALRACARSSGNFAYASAFSNAADRVLTGKSLTAALEGSALPPLALHMAAIGEKSGQIDEAMESLGAFYQKMLDARVKIIAEMIGPVLVLMVAGVAGFVYFAFFQAMLTISTGA
jgi:type IV pilus assembly protein PilC